MAFVGKFMPQRTAILTEPVLLENIILADS